MLIAIKDEAGGNLNNEENNFMLDNAYGDYTFEELTAALIMMARIHPANDKAEIRPKYDAEAVSEVNALHIYLITGMISNSVHNHKNHRKLKTVINTSDDDQINSNIIFDDPYMENYSGKAKYVLSDHDPYCDIKTLAYNVQKEAENQKQLNDELKKSKRVATKREICAEKDAIERILKEKDKIKSDFFKVENEKLIIQHETQLAKKDFKEREDRYLEDIVDLEKKLSSHDRIVYKMGQSIQTIQMLEKTPNKVYDHFLKAGLGYKNPERLKKASKDNKSKNRVLKNTNVTSPSTNVRKVSRSVSVESNKSETMNLTVRHSNASVLNTKTVNDVKDGLNLVCVSCGKDVIMLSHAKSFAQYALYVDSRVKRALFTSTVAPKSRNLGANVVVTKSRFSIAKTPTTTNKVIKLVLWIIDSGCSKHMTGNLKLLRNFVEKFMGTGDDFLIGSQESNLYTISIFDLAASSLVCFMSKATSIKSWLWHRRLSHLNFGSINQLTSKDLVDRISKFKYNKEHLCSACEQGKGKKATFPSKLVPSTNSKLELLHVDLCGPMWVESINGKKYILVIVDDYSQYTWDPLNMHEFYQKHRSVDMWNKNHPIEQVIGDPSKLVMTRSRLHTDAKMCMYALIASTIELKNIKEAMLDHSWIESTKEELNQFKRLDVWELIECLVGRNIIAVE
uniref:Ribonuclease H-like domain-containing protein n=1 Tax=Tanacetum cinerariifolium TaxID=118510 RepID=A0A6L2JT28_TANCI|nr:ribonuclease H-like domain-containing protein [Tanacetum cinerariifolium]